MCGNAGPHMPWHSCRGERTTFGVSSHCPLCFRQGALCLYHCRCRNSWPVSFQDCCICSHLGAALGSTQGAVLTLYEFWHLKLWCSCLHSKHCIQRAILSVLTSVGDMVSQGWPLNSLSSCLSLNSSWDYRSTPTHRPEIKSILFFWERISFCSSFWLGIWYVIQAGLIETLVPQSPKSCITGVSQHTQQKF